MTKEKDIKGYTTRETRMYIRGLEEGRQQAKREQQEHIDKLIKVNNDLRRINKELRKELKKKQDIKEMREND